MSEDIISMGSIVERVERNDEDLKTYYSADEYFFNNDSIKEEIEEIEEKTLKAGDRKKIIKTIKGMKMVYECSVCKMPITIGNLNRHQKTRRHVVALENKFWTI